MPESSEPQVDLFEVEPVTQLDGSPVPRQARPGGNTWRERLGLPGMLALAEGLALLGCFFCFPWFYFPDLNTVPEPESTPPLATYSGWSTALGQPIGGGHQLILFVHLWLVPLTALTLLALALVYVQFRFSARLTLGVLIALSVLALLVEAGFYMQVFWLKPVLFGGPGGGNWIGVVWGLWAAVVVNVAAIAASVYLLWRARSRPAAAEAEGV